MTVATPLLRLLARVPTRTRPAAAGAPVILVYHGVPARPTVGVWRETFETHARYLSRHMEVVAPAEVGAIRAASRPRVLLTFDDGFRNNAEVVVPILRRHRLPALFFVCSRHAIPGRYLWFSYLRALERHYRHAALTFRGLVLDMSERMRSVSVRRLSDLLLSLRPHPAAMYEAIEHELPPLEEFVPAEDLVDDYAGMTPDQLGEMAADPLFQIGAHTADHPFLTRCGEAEAFRQVDASRRWIESVCGRPCDAIAYPSGDYDSTVIRVCMDAGFIQGHAVTPRRAGQQDFERERIGIYASSLDVLAFKLRWGRALRNVRVPIG